jgi:hypothetical protein
MELDLVAQVSVGALEVGRELMTQLCPGGEGLLSQVHERRPGRTGQGHQEIVGHDGLISSCDEYRGGVNLQELCGVDTPVVLHRQVGLELVWSYHQVKVWGKRHAATPRSHQGRMGASSLPHRGGVHCIKVPIKVTTLAAVPLPLVLDGDAAVLTQVTTLKFGPQICHGETCDTY